MLLQYIYKLFNSSFIRNVSAVTICIFISQLILLLFSPIISRIYEPESLATLTLVTSISLLLSPLFNGNYSMSIVLGDTTYNNFRLFIP